MIKIGDRLRSVVNYSEFGGPQEGELCFIEKLEDNFHISLRGYENLVALPITSFVPAPEDTVESSPWSYTIHPTLLAEVIGHLTTYKNETHNLETHKNLEALLAELFAITQQQPTGSSG